jgi:hypothetical protein
MTRLSGQASQTGKLFFLLNEYFVRPWAFSDTLVSYAVVTNSTEQSPSW